MVLEASRNCATTEEYTTSSLRNDFAHSVHEPTLADRKLSLLRRTGLFSEDLKGCTIERACTADDLRKAYELVHEVFLGRGYIRPDPTRMRVRIFETTPETATFVAKVDDRVVGVLSVVPDSEELGLPSDSAYKSELDELRQAGRRLCEVTNQVVLEEYRKSGVTTELIKCVAAVSLTEGFNETIVTVSPGHCGFYELLGFRQIGPQRSYSETLNDPVTAFSLDVDPFRIPLTGLSAAAQFVRHYLAEGNHFVSQVRDWADEARRQFLNPDSLRQLFVLDENLLARFAPTELSVLCERWGRENFAAVTADIFLPRSASRHHESELRFETQERDIPFHLDAVPAW
jgi:ribosomal protein S18 acetylase RimI-like enzyme